MGWPFETSRKRSALGAEMIPQPDQLESKESLPEISPRRRGVSPHPGLDYASTTMPTSRAPRADFSEPAALYDSFRRDLPGRLHPRPYLFESGGFYADRIFRADEISRSPPRIVLGAWARRHARAQLTNA